MIIKSSPNIGSRLIQSFISTLKDILYTTGAIITIIPKAIRNQNVDNSEIKRLFNKFSKPLERPTKLKAVFCSLRVSSSVAAIFIFSLD